jgi:hypothetical protein
MSFHECRQAINELLQDNILGNSLNGGKRFGRTIRDDQKEASYDNVPSKCSYREEDAQIIFNPLANGRAHTSLAPICRTNPSGEDRQTLGCLPKCLENGEWSQQLATCEKDWCHPIFEEWHCCDNRAKYRYEGDLVDDVNYKVKFLEMDYYVAYHDLDEAQCPVG